MPCIRKIVRASNAEDQNAVIALLQLADVPGRVRSSGSTTVSGVQADTWWKHSLKMSLGPRPREVMRAATISFLNGRLIK